MADEQLSDQELRIELSITPPGDRLPMEDVYQAREHDRLLNEQYSTISMDPTSAKIQQSAEGGQALAPVSRIVSPMESSSEHARARAQTLLQMPMYQKMLGQVSQSIFGMTLEDWQKASETGEIPKTAINLNWMAPGVAVASDVFAQAAEHHALETGVPPELSQHMGTVAGLLAGVLFPAGGFKKGKKAVEEARVLNQQSREALRQFLAGEVPAEAVSRLNVGRVNAEESIKTTMTTLNKLNAERLEAGRRTVSHAETIAAASGLPPVPAGHVRLYRGEGERKGGPIWKDPAMNELAGRWFAEHFPTAAEFESQANAIDKSGRILYIDVPRAVVEESRLSKQPNLQKFAYGGVEPSQIVLPAEWAGKAKPFPSGKPALSIEQALKLPDAEFVLDKDKGTALRDLYNSVSTRMDHLKTRLLQGDTAVEGEFIDTFLIANELARKDELVGRGVARALEARKIQSEAGRAPVSIADLNALREKFGEMTGVSGPTLAAMLDQLTAEQKRTFLRQFGHVLSTGQNMFYEAWINALLSGPQTHAANVASNALTAVWAPGERFLAATLDFGKDRSVFFGESAAMLYGAIEGMKDGVRAAAKALKTGEGPFGGEKTERVAAITAKGFGFDPETVLGASADYLGALVRSPGRALMTEDAFFKALNYRMELRAYSYRVARQEGGENIGARMREIMANPPSAVKSRAEQFALVQTFNQDLSELGWVGAAAGGLMQAAEAMPMGRVVLPFVRTPTNILHFTMERTPILNALSDTLRADVMAGGERRALAFGKISSGLMASGAVASLAAAGLITGGGPQDKTLKENLRLTGWQPYSIKIGDTWYAYNRLDPLGSMLGIMADYAEISGEIPADRRLEFAAAMGLAVSRNMISKTYLEGLSNVFEALADPERGSEKYLKGLARSLTPSGVRQATRAMDPTLHETRALTEVETLLNEMRAGIPGYAADLPARRNLWGDPILLSGGWGPDLISPIYTSPLKHDPVSDEIVRLKVPLALPRPVMFGQSEPRTLQFEESRPAKEGVPLTPGEYDLLLRLSGKGVGSQPPLKDALATLMASEAYRTYTDGPDGSRALAISSLVSGYKQAARGALLDPNYNPGAQALRDALEAKANAKGDALRPSPLGVPPKGLLESLGR